MAVFVFSRITNPESRSTCPFSRPTTDDLIPKHQNTKHQLTPSIFITFSSATPASCLYFFLMDIRSQFPYWIEKKSPHFARAQAVSSDIAYDVVVVGAGVSGALIAHHLAARGVDVAVLDRRQPASASTAACTALVQYELDQPLTTIAKLHSLDHAEQAYRTCLSALDWLAAHIQTLDDHCDLAIRPTILLARKKRDLDPMQQEVATRNAAGIPVNWLDEQTLLDKYQIHRPGAIESSRSLELDPFRLTVATLNAAVNFGARVYAPAEVIRYDFDDTGVALQLSHGPVVRARNVIVANGYETPPFLRQGYGKLLSTWAVTSEPFDLQTYWPNRQMVWEWGQAYLYARTTPDNRLIFGGGDRRFTNAALRDALIPTKTATLTRHVQRMIPGLEVNPAYAWAGTFAETEDGMPYIGPHGDFPHTYVALGYGGNGVTFSIIAARILTGILCDDPEMRAPQPLFAFDR